jgi:hypothetical protein
MQMELCSHKTGVAMIQGELKALKGVGNAHPFITSLHFAFNDRFVIVCNQR